MRVAVLGASVNSERYSNKALRRLVAHGHEAVPVNPAHAEIEGVPAVRSLSDLPPGSIDTVTVYVGPQRSAELAEQLVTLAPRRVIFNPGAENPELAARLRRDGVESGDACTLVLLATQAF